MKEMRIVVCCKCGALYDLHYVDNVKMDKGRVTHFECKNCGMVEVVYKEGVNQMRGDKRMKEVSILRVGHREMSVKRFGKKIREQMNKGKGLDDAYATVLNTEFGIPFDLVSSITLRIKRDGVKRAFEIYKDEIEYTMRGGDDNADRR